MEQPSNTLGAPGAIETASDFVKLDEVSSAISNLRGQRESELDIIAKAQAKVKALDEVIKAKIGDLFTLPSFQDFGEVYEEYLNGKQIAYFKYCIEQNLDDAQVKILCDYYHNRKGIIKNTIVRSTESVELKWELHDDGTITVNDKAFTSPTAAAKYYTGYSSIAGTDFFGTQNAKSGTKIYTPKTKK